MFERTDINLTPVWPWIMYGDGYMAQVISIVPDKDVDGQEVYKIVIIPTKELAKKHNLTLENLDQRNLSIKFEYPRDMVIPLSNDPSFPVYFCFLNVMGEDCPSTESLTGKIETEKIIGLRKIIQLLKSENAYLTEKLEKASSNVREFIKDDIMGPAKELNQSIMNQMLNQGQGRPQ